MSKVILFGEEHLRHALPEFTAHYHQDRPHQSPDNNPIAPANDRPPDGDKVVVDARLGGLLHSYRPTA